MSGYIKGLKTSERLERLRRRLDANGVVSTCRMINASQKRLRKSKRAQRQWQRDQIDMAVQIGRDMGLLPGTGGLISWLAWLAIKLVVEAYLRRLFFGETGASQ